MRNPSLITLLLFVTALMAQLPDRSRFNETLGAILSTELIFARTADLSKLEEILGKPESTSESFLNIDGTDPAVFPDTERGVLRVLNFKGLVIELYESAVDRRTIIKTVDLSSGVWKFPKKLKIGSTQEEVKTFLGEPKTSSVPNVYTYQSHEAYLDEVQFYFTAGKVVRIRWSFEI